MAYTMISIGEFYYYPPVFFINDTHEGKSMKTFRNSFQFKKKFYIKFRALFSDGNATRIKKQNVDTNSGR